LSRVGVGGVYWALAENSAIWWQQFYRFS